MRLSADSERVGDRTKFEDRKKLGKVPKCNG